MTLYLIGIGGTGAKCLEAITHIAATGLFDEESIKVLFIDADETNGNLEQSRISLSIYQNCYQLMQGDKQECSWLNTSIESFDIWSPFGNTSINKNLSSFFNYNSIKQNQQSQALGNLFDILYTKEEREANLDVGFRGRPAIGSAVMSRLDLNDFDQEPWGKIIGQIQADVSSGKSPKILFCGSIFGGTGASGLPTIGRLLSNKLEKEKVRGRVKIGCLFVLPYFGFAPKLGETKEEVYARSELFLLNTEAALRYYVQEAKQFDTIYLLGNQNFSQYKFSIGKKTQRNEPHFIELYAALAARHFLTAISTIQDKVILISRQYKDKLIWNDLPESHLVKEKLANATRFAVAWLGNIAPELDTARQIGVVKFQKAAPWFTKFFRSHQGGLGTLLGREADLPDFNNSSQQEAISIISNWCQDYLRWLSQIHNDNGDSIQLFNRDKLVNLDSQSREEELSHLLVYDQRDTIIKGQDNVQKLKELLLDHRAINPPNQGTAGLAKSIYILCNLKK